MGILQEIAEMVGSENLKRLADGQGDFDKPGTPDARALEEMFRNIDPDQLKRILGRTAQSVDSQEYSDHVTPDVGGTNPLGRLDPESLGMIASVLLGRLKEAGLGNLASLAKQLGLGSTEPDRMNPQDVARVAGYTQQNQPEAFGKAAAEIGQQKPHLLHSFLGKAALALTAAALASHFVKLDKK